MPRPLAWICLIVALTGPALAHAEAADDLARSLVGMADEGQVVPTDGGVGDDPIEASFGKAGPESVLVHPAISAPVDFEMLRPVGDVLSGSLSIRLRHRGDPWPTPSPARRYVWLQTFLI